MDRLPVWAANDVVSFWLDFVATSLRIMMHVPKGQSHVQDTTPMMKNSRTSLPNQRSQHTFPAETVILELYCSQLVEMTCSTWSQWFRRICMCQGYMWPFLSVRPPTGGKVRGADPFVDDSTRNKCRVFGHYCQLPGKLAIGDTTSTVDETLLLKPSSKESYTLDQLWSIQIRPNKRRNHGSPEGARLACQSRRHWHFRHFFRFSCALFIIPFFHIL